MSENNTFSWAGQVELSADQGVRIRARRTVGGVCLTRITDFDGGPMRSLELTDAALERLVALINPRAVQVEQSIEYLRNWEGAILSILSDNAEAASASEQAGVEVSDDWTHWLPRRFLARTWQEAVIIAAAAKRHAETPCVADDGPGSPLPPDVHGALLAASGQSDSVGSAVDYGSGHDEFPCLADLGRGLEP